MQIEQISIFMENKSGRLAEVTSALSEGGIIVKAMILADLSDFGVLRMIVDDAKKAKEHLKNQGFVVNSTSVFAVELENDTRQIHDVLASFNRAGINVEYMYAFANVEKNSIGMVFMVDDPDKASQVLE